jgi:protein-disulfide isomerase
MGTRHRPASSLVAGALAGLALLTLDWAHAAASAVPPEPASIDALQQITSAGRRAILAAPLIESRPARPGDVRIVEYFDYNCPFCRRVAPTLAELLARDSGTVLVYKDWPVFGAVSVYAAHCALAARYQGKYREAQAALLAGPRLTQDSQVLAVLSAAGIDLGRLRNDLADHADEISHQLARNDAEARALELDGTPGLVIGSRIVPGIASLGFFEQLVASARRER